MRKRRQIRSSIRSPFARASIRKPRPRRKARNHRRPQRLVRRISGADNAFPGDVGFEEPRAPCSGFFSSSAASPSDGGGCWRPLALLGFEDRQELRSQVLVTAKDIEDAMLRSKPQPIRNKLDLGDRAQVRLIKKRLRLSETELTAIVGRIGNSISAISNEATAERARIIPRPPQLPPAAVIVTVVGSDPAASDISMNEQAP